MTMESTSEGKTKKLEAILWSIALPGFWQLCNKLYIKGIFFIILEILFNVMGNINTIIMLSLTLQIEEAIAATNYQWYLFYPCLYFFAIWDAYKGAGGGRDKPFAYIPLVCTAYFVTLGIIYSNRFTLFGYLLGPIWIVFLTVPIGLIIGSLIRSILKKWA